jgi:hypothetical protein
MTEKHVSIQARLGMSLFEPDILATVQYYDRMLYARRLDPERMLMIAVLDDAVNCFQKWSFASSSRAKASYRELQDWFMNEKSDQLFGFENICEVLGLNPDYIRAGLVYWKKNRDPNSA